MSVRRSLSEKGGNLSVLREFQSGKIVTTIILFTVQ